MAAVRSGSWSKSSEINPRLPCKVGYNLTDWEYRLVQHEFPGATFFGAACEFGTFGESILAGARSLRITIFKNQLNQHGASAPTAAWVENEYRELYLPSAAAWFEKALSDARQTFNGVFGVKRPAA